MMDIDSFKENLRSLSVDQMFDRCILTGSCAQLADNVAYNVRSSISGRFDVEYNNVIIVGSANLGFSIKPKKRYIAFGEESDVDIAIVCSRLFENVWREIYMYDKSGAYWENKGAFRKYLAKGWIRPDMLPPSAVCSFSNNWWEYFSSLRIDGCDYKITGGIYHSHFFLRQYQTICIEQCKTELL